MAIIGIIGNLAADYSLLNENKENNENLKRIIKNAGIELNKEPKQMDYRTGIVLEEILQNLDVMIKVGGGGYNSLRAFELLNNHKLEYLDLTENSQENLPLISRTGIEYVFLNKCPLSKSLILNIENDRKILKTLREDKNARLSNQELDYFIKKIGKYEGLFINSFGNYNLAEIIGQQKSDIEKFIVVTKSLSYKELLNSKIVNNATAIIDIDEADFINQSLEYTNGRVIKSNKNLEKINKTLYQLGAKRTIITMGKSGVAFFESENNKTTRIYMPEIIENKIQKYISDFRIKKNGAGDYFAGCVFHSLMLMKERKKEIDLPRILGSAQLFVIENLFKYPEFLSIDEIEIKR
jgi:hypothetical protein